MLVLIADDDRATTTILTSALENFRVDIVAAHDGHRAWEILSGPDRPSLAIVGWMMPGVNGLELCRRIRQESALARVYVILLAGRNGRGEVVTGLDVGADDYVVKPFDNEELRARVQVGVRVAGLLEQIRHQALELEAAQNDLTLLGSTDMLTGLNSRRQWFEQAAGELARFQRYRRPLAFLMIDVDRFKELNDTHGHQMGDQVLRQFADILRHHCRQSDVAGRVGGEVFAVMLPETTAAAAYDVGARIAEHCRTFSVQTPAGGVKFSCSIGVTEAVAGDETVEGVLRRADAALYQAKRNGRDRVEIIHTIAQFVG